MKHTRTTELLGLSAFLFGTVTFAGPLPHVSAPTGVPKIIMPSQFAEMDKQLARIHGSSTPASMMLKFDPRALGGTQRWSYLANLYERNHAIRDYTARNKAAGLPVPVITSVESVSGKNGPELRIHGNGFLPIKAGSQDDGDAVVVCVDPDSVGLDSQGATVAPLYPTVPPTRVRVPVRWTDSSTLLELGAYKLSPHARIFVVARYGVAAWETSPVTATPTQPAIPVLDLPSKDPLTGYPNELARVGFQPRPGLKALFYNHPGFMVEPYQAEVRFGSDPWELFYPAKMACTDDRCGVEIFVPGGATSGVYYVRTELSTRPKGQDALYVAVPFSIGTRPAPEVVSITPSTVAVTQDFTVLVRNAYPGASGLSILVDGQLKLNIKEPISNPGLVLNPRRFLIGGGHHRVQVRNSYGTSAERDLEVIAQ